MSISLLLKILWIKLFFIKLKLSYLNLFFPNTKSVGKTKTQVYDLLNSKINHRIKKKLKLHKKRIILGHLILQLSFQHFNRFYFRVYHGQDWDQL